MMMMMISLLSADQRIALFLLLLITLVNYYPIIVTDAFSISTVPSSHRRTKPSSTTISTTCRCDRIRLYLSNVDDSGGGTKKKKGDSLRSATGIRPSLHPTTINCIAEALLLRSQCVLGKGQNNDGTEIAIDTANNQVEPLQIAITAGGIAMAAIDQRKDAATTDETTDAFTVEESQTISGRVVGVVMRMRELEQGMIQKVNEVNWVTKYGEEESFGLLKKECKRRVASESNDAASSSDERIVDELEKQLAETIKINPLFRMNRAECLLALFLSTIEAPQMEKLGQDVVGGSAVDFIDSDRLEVLS